MRESKHNVSNRGTASGDDVTRDDMQTNDGKDRDMGMALRSVYQRTVDEQIPDDLLDLLGKLS